MWLTLVSWEGAVPTQSFYHSFPPTMVVLFAVGQDKGTATYLLVGLKVLCFAHLPRAVDSHDSVTICVSLCPLPEVRVYDLYLALN